MSTPSARQPLTPDDWIAAAFRRLAQGGVAALKAEAIARDLRVSKGSFYWHFRDLQDLKSKMLSHWLDRATLQIMAVTKAASVSAEARLSHLGSLVSSDLSAPYGGPMAEVALREWARIDDMARAAQDQADALRLDFIASLLRDAGLTQDAAARGARQIYCGYLGAQHLGGEARDAMSDDLQDLMARILRS